MLRPIAIPAFKGLSFLTGRSRSSPPVPRNVKTASAHLTVPEAAKEAGDGKQKLEHDTPVDASPRTHEKFPEIMSALTVDMPATPAPAYLHLPVAAPPIPAGGDSSDDAARVRQGGSAITSRSTSPGPALSEALLRARRPATPHAPSTTPTKGTRFKSSFVGVADHVLRLEGQHQVGNLGDKNRDEVRVKNGGPSGGPEAQEGEGEEMGLGTDTMV